MTDWCRFRVGNVGERTCALLPFVTHTSHVSSALQIIEAGEIRPSLVFDESILNDRRILVSWFSPNTWHAGYRYGNVQFRFDFDQLVAGKRYYWVEAISYEIKALRILITDVDRDAQLQAYDPSAREGPWWFDKQSGHHYFNGEYCLEFMVEAPVSLDMLTDFDFVKHHREWCSVHRNAPRRCGELNAEEWQGGAWLLTRAVATGIDLSRLRGLFVLENGRAHHKLEGPLRTFLRKFNRTCFSGTITEDSVEAEAVIRAVMSAYSFGHPDEAQVLAALFASDTNFSRSAARIMSEAVEFESWKTLSIE